MKIIAHRGAAAKLGENTLAAVKQAIKLPFDGVEFDVRRASDGKLVLMHDATINRTTTGHGRVSRLSWQELQAVRTRDGATVPALDTVMRHLKTTDKIINIEIKSHGCAQGVAGYAAWPNVYVSSAIESELLELRRLAPGGRYGLVVRSPLTLLMAAKTRPFAFLAVPQALINARVMRYLKRKKSPPLWVFTVKNYRRVRQLDKYGAEAIFSDVLIR